MQYPKSFSADSMARQRFQTIVEWAVENHPFYQKHLSADKEIPVLTRELILDNNEALLNGHEVTGTTSGSTGVPVKTSWSPQRMNIEKQVTEKFVSWIGGRKNVSRLIHLAEDENHPNSIDVNSPINEQIDFLMRRYRVSDSTAITTYPTNAERLCQAVIDQGLNMDFIERFGCYAEVFEPHHERLIEQAFPNAQIWTTYSSTEFGMIAARCPHEPDYHHVFTGKLGVEILDEQGEPCEKGQLGRLVITDYFNTYMPLIRYEIGDLAAWGDCPCGKIAFPAFSQVAGKVRGALVHRNGERVPFTQLSVALRDIEGMRQYQVIQHQLEQFEIRYVTQAEDDMTLREQIVKKFVDHFGYEPKISLTREEIIERGENGKYYASISKV